MSLFCLLCAFRSCRCVEYVTDASRYVVDTYPKYLWVVVISTMPFGVVKDRVNDEEDLRRFALEGAASGLCRVLGEGTGDGRQQLSTTTIQILDDWTSTEREG